MNINLKIVSLLLAVTFVLLSGAAVAKENSALSAKHKKLVKAFPEVEHLSGAALQGLDREQRKNFYHSTATKLKERRLFYIVRWVTDLQYSPTKYRIG